MENSWFLPQIVSGEGWDTQIFLKNLSKFEGEVVVEFFGSDGLPLDFATSKGQGNSFEISLLPFASVELSLLRQGEVKTGWARIRSTLNIGVNAVFCQYTGNSIAGMGGIDSSPPQSVFAVDLSPQNGFALVNPNRETASVKARVFGEDGIELSALERNFTMLPGNHFAKFFFEPPFSFGSQKGLVVVSSNVPLVPLAVRLEGYAFGTIPILPAPRRVEIRQKPIGVVYFVPSDRTPQPDVEKRANEVFTVFQKLLDAELPLNGFKRRELIVERDEAGLPKVNFVRGKKPVAEYWEAAPDGCKFQGIDFRTINREIDLAVNIKNYSTLLYFVDTSDYPQVYDPTVDARGYHAFAMLPEPALSLPGRAWVNAVHLPFLKQDYFENTSSYYGIPVPELGGIVFTGNTYLTGALGGSKYQYAAEYSFFVAAHELTHALGLGFHTKVSDWQTYTGILGIGGIWDGQFRDSSVGQAILLPPEARMLSASLSMVSDLDWIKADATPPAVTVISKGFSEGEVSLELSLNDPESGVIALLAWRGGSYYPILYYKALTHTDQGNIKVRFTAPAEVQTDGLGLAVFNSQGYVGGRGVNF